MKKTILFLSIGFILGIISSSLYFFNFQNKTEKEIEIKSEKKLDLNKKERKKQEEIVITKISDNYNEYTDSCY